MDTVESRGGFSSRLGFLLATAGAAVGLGNLWRFPYLAEEYGGGIFLLVYLILVVTFGVAMLITELAIGRRTGKSCFDALMELAGKHPIIGWVATLVPLIITLFLAFWKRDAVLALFIGCIVGVVLLGMDPAFGFSTLAQWEEHIARVREELARLGELCCRYGVTIVSDEIHADLALPGYCHTPMAAVSEEIAARMLTAMAPSKTFNIAGLMNSVVVASNPELLERYNRELVALHLDSGNIFGHVALKAAYRHGGEWLDAMLCYVNGNVDFALDYFRRELPEVQVCRPEGSFLLWLDFNALGLSHEECGERLLRRGKIALNDGLTFGEEGRGFRRMNVGCPRSVLEEGLRRIKRAFE